MKFAKNCCPNCNSTSVTVDVDVRITCSLENGALKVKPYWYNDKGAAMLDNTDVDNDFGAYCEYCCSYLNVTKITASGIVFATIPKNGIRNIDKKYN